MFVSIPSLSSLGRLTIAPKSHVSAPVSTSSTSHYSDMAGNKPLLALVAACAVAGTLAFS